MSRSLNAIARDIMNDWRKPYFGAVPYIRAMHDLDSIHRPLLSEQRYVVARRKSKGDQSQIEADGRRKMTNEFQHYDGCGFKDPNNCSACALTDQRQPVPNYAAWPLAYMENRRVVPEKWKPAFYDD